MATKFTKLNLGILTFDFSISQSHYSIKKPYYTFTFIVNYYKKDQNIKCY